jgi:hypothetical protein
MASKIRSAICGGLALLASAGYAASTNETSSVTTNKPSIISITYSAPEKSYPNGSYILDIALPSSNTNTYSVVYTTNLTGNAVWKPSVMQDNRSLKYSGQNPTNYVSVQEPAIGNKRFFGLDLSPEAN